ncbi:hypothetical protein [Thermocoleostomius sinensis]|uniref:Uncharacterized protein n=2 Tax=Thermocoleostomius sinensis A174 TaxID=2016057 RepID=A0A9E8Z940_9CYAN|nr:hypothetical protein [Thermocoleostomius sinensis]WAL58567.1 hypothetical protein OXH18_15415 [Thermocoleostomius sinensis A174]
MGESCEGSNRLATLPIDSTFLEGVREIQPSSTGSVGEPPILEVSARSRLQHNPQKRNTNMTGEWNEQLPIVDDDRVQIWIIGSREQVTHQMNEFYVRKMTNDRVKFTPIIPAPFAAGKYMTVLVR